MYVFITFFLSRSIFGPNPYLLHVISSLVSALISLEFNFNLLADLVYPLLQVNTVIPEYGHRLGQSLRVIFKQVS